MNATLWVVLLLCAGLAVMMLEVFIPSGGVLGFVSIAAIISAISMAFFQIGIAGGLTVLGFSVLAVPATLALAFRWFPNTTLGRRVLPPPPDPMDVLPAMDQRKRLREYIGGPGHAVDELLPWGTVMVSGSVQEAMSESGAIPAGAAIEVVDVQGMALIVREVHSDAAGKSGPAQPLQTVLPESSCRSKNVDKNEQLNDQEDDSPLSPMLETFKFDDLDQPGA